MYGQFSEFLTAFLNELNELVWAWERNTKLLLWQF